MTGGQGFVGGVAARHLLASGHQVAVIDDHRHAAIASEPFNGEIANTGIESSYAIDFAGQFQPDVVMHFAASAEVELGEKDPLSHAANNVEAFRVFLGGLIRSTRCRSVVFSSTCAVYGQPRNCPVDEEEPIAPLSWYGWTKAFGERMLAATGKAHGVRWLALRYFNVIGTAYGIAERAESRLVPRLLCAARSGDPFMIHGQDYPTRDGTCVRDYVHVLDIVNAHVLAAERVKVLSGHAVNLGSGRGFSVLEMARAAEEVTGRQIRVEYGPRRPGDVAEVYASREKASTMLGWKPTLSVGFAIKDAWKVLGK